VGNVWSRYSNPLYDSMVRTYQDVFDELYLFTVPASGNRILSGSAQSAFTREDVIAQATALARATSSRTKLVRRRLWLLAHDGRARGREGVIDADPPRKENP